MGEAPCRGGMARGLSTPAGGWASRQAPTGGSAAWVSRRDMTRPGQALRLMVDRGHQEEGEAAGKWRRALLTSAQLSTYYVGYHEVRDAVHALRATTPGATNRQLHDAVLAHGTPPPRHLPALLDL